MMFHGKTLTLRVAQYRNGCTALALHDEDGALYAMASVALPTRHPDGCIWVKDYSENAGMKDALVLAGIIAPEAVVTVRSGYVCISAYKLLL
jgi:hypothetical protein